QRALRGLIHAFNQARDAGHTAIPAPVADPLISEFRHAIRVGLAEVRPNPGPRSSTAQPPGRTLLEFSHEREDDVLRFTTDTRIWPTNNISEVRHEVARSEWTRRWEGQQMMLAA
ncbi:MAG: hypothetical protein LC700_02555, partial [Actinobacteria bacterium]|nr:hypothetical protein [Actinomycetota bacterium]